MSRLHDFIDKAGIFFLATEDGLQPKLRPLGAHVDIDGTEYFTVGDFKDVYRQMSENPQVEIAAFVRESMTWLRYTGKAVFEENEEVTEKILEALQHLRKAYSPESGRKMMIFHLEDSTARIIDMAGNEEII